MAVTFTKKENFAGKVAVPLQQPVVNGTPLSALMTAVAIEATQKTLATQEPDMPVSQTVLQDAAQEEFKPAPAPFPSPKPPAAPSASSAALLKALAASPEEPEDSPAPDDYTILDALREYAERKHFGKTLMLIAVNAATTWVVKAYDIETGRASLENEKMTIGPKITQREVALYRPHWTSAQPSR